ncbi:MAG TPA: alpha/beta fold hydrolase [Casimicrobiaceae bacterium]|jgi:pimeloyl-ACP methyl ester carboxylesterase
MTPAFVEIAGDAGQVRIEYAWIAPERDDAPLLVFLHEGLGSLAMWRDWPRSVCSAAGARGLVYSREGYGRSTPRPHDRRWTASFMHRQAEQALPDLAAALNIDAAREAVFLVGHSDGGSIALIHAARFPGWARGVVAIAPHIKVEDVSIASIERARDAFAQGDLAARLARYHVDPESAFGGWCGAWLAPEFRRWSIEDMLRDVRCPVLAMQGERDEYGTLAQIEGIAQRVPASRMKVLADCGHSPQREKPEMLAAMIAAFIAEHA